YNPQIGPPPHHLQPGTILRLPRAGIRPDAELTFARRDVQARQPSASDWSRAEEGLDLFRGWRVNTLDESRAELTFADDSQVQMRANTLVIIYGGEARRARRSTTRAELQRGTLRSHLGELRLQVDTPGGETRLRGGDAVVSVDDEGTSTLSNHEGGQAEVRGRSGGRVRVAPGYGSRVARRSRPTPPRPLPPAPTFESGSTHFVGLASEGATLTASWGAVPDARVYRVELRIAGETPVVAAAEVPANVRNVEVHRLPAGTYEVRLSTIDTSFFESRPSEPRSATVALLELDGEGGTPDVLTPFRTPEVGLGASLSGAGYRCSLEEGNAGEEALVLSRSGEQRVHCVSPSGESAAPFLLAVGSVELVPEAEDRVVRAPADQPFEAVVTLVSDRPVQNVVWQAVGLEVLGSEVRDGQHVLSFASAQPGEYVAVATVAGHPIGEVSVQIEAPAPPPPEEAPAAEPRLPAPIGSDAIGLFRHPSVFGLRDTRPGPLTANLAVGGSGETPGEDFTRIAVGIEVAAGSMRVVVAAQPNISGATAGDDDLFVGVGVHAGGRCASGPCFGLYAELAAWAPVSGQSGAADPFIFTPSVTLSYGSPRFLLRTRQGALIADEGPRVWASAYGADVRLIGPLFVGAEVNVSLGRDTVLDEFTSHVAAGGALGLAFRPVRIGLAFQRAITDDLRRVRGDHLLVLSARTFFGER
ncbi:MAG: FecR domain-containing protein, partial [Myxococcota bacterium]